MTQQFQFDAIMHVMNALRYSLASYLQFARPYVDANGESIAEAIERVADTHNRHAVRLGRLLMRRRGHIVSRTFPSAFTALNDVSVQHTLPLVIEDCRQIVNRIESKMSSLLPYRDAHQLVMEISDDEKRHLSLLQDIQDAQQAYPASQPHPAMDCVAIASEHSFPASDAPSWTSAAATNGEARPRPSGQPVRVQAARTRRVLLHS